MKRKDWMKKMLRMCIVGLIAIVIILPMLLTILNSFSSAQGIAENYGQLFFHAGREYVGEEMHFSWIPAKFSLEQYRILFGESSDYFIKLKNSVILVLPIVVFQLVIACLASYGFMHVQGKLAAFVFFTYIILMLMPYQVTLVPNYFVAMWMNLLDTNWSIWLPSIFAPFAVYWMTRCMKRIPFEIVEAAKMDGASSFRIFRSIVMPICKEQVFSCGMLIFIDYWNMVEQPVLMFSEESKYPLSIFLARIQEETVGVAFAGAVVYMLPVLIIYFAVSLALHR